MFDNTPLYAAPETSVFKMVRWVVAPAIVLCLSLCLFLGFQAKRLRGQFLADYRRVIGDVPNVSADELAVEALATGALKGHAADIELALQLGQQSFAAFSPEMKVGYCYYHGSMSLCPLIPIFSGPCPSVAV